VVFVVDDDAGPADGASMTLREIQDHDTFMAAVRAGTLADRVITVTASKFEGRRGERRRRRRWARASRYWRRRQGVCRLRARAWR